MTITFTNHAVTEALVVLIQENPHKVNPMRCVYTSPEGEHCIAGEVIVRLGGRVPGWDKPCNETNLLDLFNTTDFDVGITLPRESRDVLYDCQRYADQGETWGNAVRRAFDMNAFPRWFQS